MALSADAFLFQLAASDTESVPIYLPSASSITAWSHIITSPLSETAEISFNVAGQRQTARNFPVFLMIGVPGWQLHIRLPVQYKEGSKPGSTRITLSGQPLIDEWPRLFTNLPLATGVGILVISGGWPPPSLSLSLIRLHITVSVIYKSLLLPPHGLFFSLSLSPQSVARTIQVLY